MSFIAVIVAFLLGAIPTGIWMGRFKGVDVQSQGSGNVGATNVYRVVGKMAGLIVLIVDVFKGFVPVVFLHASVSGGLSASESDLLKIMLGVAAVAGHIWNPFLQFKGGKGVATALGVLVGLDPRVGGLVSLVWIVITVATRYVSVGSIVAAAVSPFLLLFLGKPTSWVLGGIAIGIALIFRHRENIHRLLHGEENRVGKR